MKRFKSVTRVLFAGALVLSSAGALPALAAQADIDLLESYIGEWKGRGTMEAKGEQESVTCKLSITRAETAKLNYKGRCALAGGNLSIAGSMAYIDEKKRFEAVMSSNTTFRGVAVGTRRGNGGIDFNLRAPDEETGKEFAILAGIELKGETIDVKFSVTEIETGSKITAVVPFAK